MDTRPALGRTGEDIAADHYRERGFTVVARNYRCPIGELDLVAVRCALLVFCEVKTRRTNRWGDPWEAVGSAKQRRIRRLAGHWLRDNRPGSVEIRFDVVSVVLEGATAEVEHIPGAF